MTRAIVVMGVAGCGKSTVASALAARIGWRFMEGDDFHSRSNIEKMAHGIALQDDDRLPWLTSIATSLSECPEPAVVSCSALKAGYRELLRSAGDVRFVHLQASIPTLQARLANRPGHFMKSTMLSGQLNDLEVLGPDEPGTTLDADVPLSEVVEQVAVLAERWGLVPDSVRRCTIR